MMSSILTYGLYLYMFYTETKPKGDDIKLNVPDAAEIKSVNSNRKTLTIFYELDEEKFVKILSLESGKIIKNIKLEF